MNDEDLADLEARVAGLQAAVMAQGVVLEHLGATYERERVKAAALGVAFGLTTAVMLWWLFSGTW